VDLIKVDPLDPEPLERRLTFAPDGCGRASRGYILQTGKIVLADSSAALAANEDVKKAYLGA
jgi:ABC-type branched-subunit amino acid transport system ATPase component